MVYRTGTDGLGYYPDVASITPVWLQRELFPLDDVVPIRLCLHPLLPTTATDDNRQPQLQATTTDKK